MILELLTCALEGFVTLVGERWSRLLVGMVVAGIAMFIAVLSMSPGPGRELVAWGIALVGVGSGVYWEIFTDHS